MFLQLLLMYGILAILRNFQMPRIQKNVGIAILGSGHVMIVQYDHNFIGKDECIQFINQNTTQFSYI